MKTFVNWFDWKDNVEKKIIELIHKEKSGIYRYELQNASLMLLD